MRSFVLCVSLLCAAPVLAGDPKGVPDAGTAAHAATCEHGVKKTLCTRCNPKLAPAFKAKGDWCGDHGVPESQCVKCKPELAKKGVK